MINKNEIMHFKSHLIQNSCEVSRPSLPFVLEGPDLLVSNGVRASMVFFPRPYERRAPRLLAGRIAGALLAYPSHVEPVAVLQSDASDDIANALYNRLPIATSPGDLLKLATTKGRRTVDDNKELRRIKQLHFRRFSRIAATRKSSDWLQFRANKFSSQFQLSLTLSEIHRGDKAIFGVRAAQTEVGIWLSAVSPRTMQRAAIELTQTNLGLLYEIKNAVPHPTSSVVNKGLIADNLISAGREDAFWFALVHTAS